MSAELFGTADHASMVTQGRHPGVVHALAWLAFSHLPENLQDYSRPFYQAAVALVTTIQTDSAELTNSLNRIVEAKNWGVCAGILAEQGKPGPVPRPQTVVDPPVSLAGVLPNHPVFGIGRLPVRPDQQLPGSDR